MNFKFVSRDAGFKFDLIQIRLPIHVSQISLPWPRPRNLLNEYGIMTTSETTLPLIGVDTGGTFTDLVLVDGERVATWKLPSTPDDPSRAVLEGVRRLLGEGAALVFHGSTVATNALLEGKGAPVALVVTEGFRDLLRIGRQNRPELYALHPRRRPALVPPERTVEASERVLADGSVEKPLEAQEISRVVAGVRGDGVRLGGPLPASRLRQPRA